MRSKRWEDCAIDNVVKREGIVVVWFRVSDLGFRVSDLGSRVRVLGYRV